jgi:hypothetical protein
MMPNACKDAAAHVDSPGGFFDGDVCEQQNPELGRKLKAEHDKSVQDYEAAHPIQHYGSGSSYSGAYRPPVPDLFEEAEKAQQHIYHDEEIRSEQRWLDWALEPMGR